MKGNFGFSSLLLTDEDAAYLFEIIFTLCGLDSLFLDLCEFVSAQHYFLFNGPTHKHTQGASIGLVLPVWSEVGYTSSGTPVPKSVH